MIQGKESTDYIFLHPHDKIVIPKETVFKFACQILEVYFREFTGKSACVFRDDTIQYTQSNI